MRRRIDIVEPNRRVTITRSVIDANARIEIRGAGNAELEKALRDWVLDELATRFKEGSSMSVHAAASDVVRWPVLLATTLDAFVPPATRGAVVETLILSDDETGRAPALEVRALADFTGVLERVDVQIEPLSGGDVVDLSLTDASSRSVPPGTLDFRWRNRIKTKDHPSGEWGGWQEEHGRSGLLVPVSISSHLAIEVLAWHRLRRSMGCDSRRPGASSSGLVSDVPCDRARCRSRRRDLDAGARRRSRPGRRTRDVRLKQGRSMEQQIDEIANDQFIIVDPMETGRVRVVLVPAGTGWGQVALAMVDLRYVDGDVAIDETVELRRLDNFVEWEAPARADGPQSIKWRRHVSFTDGRFESGAWTTAAPGVVVVRVDGVPQRKVQIIPVFFDSTVTRQGVLRLRNDTQSQTVTITDCTPRTVNLASGPFTWSITWTMADGTVLPESPPQAREDVIVLPRFSNDQVEPRHGCASVQRRIYIPRVGAVRQQRCRGRYLQ